MAGVTKNFKGLQVQIKSEDDVLLKEAVIRSHEINSNIITIDYNTEMDDNQIVNVVVISSPPIYYKGRLFGTKRYFEIRLFKGEARENRISQRFNVDRKSAIVRYIDDDRYYKLLNNIGVKMMNISEHGLRIKGSDTMLNDRDRVQITFLVNEQVRIYDVEVRNKTIKGKKTAEYGCKFIKK